VDATLAVRAGVGDVDDANNSRTIGVFRCFVRLQKRREGRSLGAVSVRDDLLF
tara:strand:- start:445 stop:603 length:159 start_codon:yes stop_codon:yes gene_type:complete